MSTIQISAGRLSQANARGRVVRAIGRLLVRAAMRALGVSPQGACSPAAAASACTGLVEAFRSAFRSIRRYD